MTEVGFTAVCPNNHDATWVQRYFDNATENRTVWIVHCNTCGNGQTDT